MLDRKYILENAAAVKQNCIDRGATADVDGLVKLETKRRELLQKVQDLNTQANQVSKTIGQAKDAAERDARKEEGRKLREQKDAAQTEHDELEEKILDIARMIPNLTHPDAPLGEDDQANLELRKGAEQTPYLNEIQ